MLRKAKQQQQLDETFTFYIPRQLQTLHPVLAADRVSLGFQREQLFTSIYLWTAFAYPVGCINGYEVWCFELDEAFLHRAGPCSVETGRRFHYAFFASGSKSNERAREHLPTFWRLQATPLLCGTAAVGVGGASSGERNFHSRPTGAG